MIDFRLRSGISSNEHRKYIKGYPVWSMHAQVTASAPKSPFIREVFDISFQKLYILTSQSSPPVMMRLSLTVEFRSQYFLIKV